MYDISRSDRRSVLSKRLSSSTGCEDCFEVNVYQLGVIRDFWDSLFIQIVTCRFVLGGIFSYRVPGDLSVAKLLDMQLKRSIMWSTNHSLPSSHTSSLVSTKTKHVTSFRLIITFDPLRLRAYANSVYARARAPRRNTSQLIMITCYHVRTNDQPTTNSSNNKNIPTKLSFHKYRRIFWTNKNISVTIPVTSLRFSGFHQQTPNSAA